MRLLGWITFFIGALTAGDAAASSVSSILDGIEWGENSAALAHAFAGRAIKLTRPIEFGDSYVDVALRGEMLGGYVFTVYFQMDKATHLLKRVMYERQRHGANPVVYRAVVAALQGDYGAPAIDCTHRALAHTAYPASGNRVWQAHGVAIHAVFNDGTLEAAEGCTFSAIGPCGLTGHLYVMIAPHPADAPLCGAR